MNIGAANRGAKYPLHLRSRVSAEQLENIKENALMAGMSVSKYVRHRALYQRVDSKVDAQVIRELRRIGGLLKYLATKGENTESTLCELKTTIKALQD